MLGHGRRPKCFCGVRAAPVEGVGRNALAYQAWQCSYWPAPRCDFGRVVSVEGYQSRPAGSAHRAPALPAS